MKEIINDRRQMNNEFRMKIKTTVITLRNKDASQREKRIKYDTFIL